MAKPAKPAPGPARRPRRWRRRLILLLVTTIATMLLVETGLWLLDLYPPMPRAYPGEHQNRIHPTFEADDLLGWRTRPGLDVVLDGEGKGSGKVPYVADENGRRTGPGRRPAASATHTIVLAGDSFLWGVGVPYEQCITALLEAHFAETRVENLAQPAFGVDQIVLSVLQHGLALRPDLVVVGIYPHDVKRTLTAYREDFGFNKPTFLLRSGKLVPMTEVDRPGSLWRFVEDHSRLLGLWRRAQRNVGFDHGIGSWWAVSAALLDRLRTATAEAGCALLIVHVPFYDWRPFAALSDYCHLHGVRLLDPVVIDTEKPSGIYFPPDGHFTPVGHRYLRDLLVDWIERMGPASLR